MKLPTFSLKANNKDVFALKKQNMTKNPEAHSPPTNQSLEFCTKHFPTFLGSFTSSIHILIQYRVYFACF